MLIEAENHQKVRCPFLGGRNCLGRICATWRDVSATHGYCGAGGPPEVGATPAPAVIQAEKQTTNGASARHARGGR